MNVSKHQHITLNQLNLYLVTLCHATSERRKTNDINKEKL